MKRTPLRQGKGFNKGNKPLKSGSALKSHKNMRNASGKKNVRNGKKKETYKYIDESRPQICEGCGEGNKALSHSHLISVARNVSLEAEPRNIRLHCLSLDGVKGCHEKWEDGIEGEITRMLDFRDNMKILKELDPKYYLVKHMSIYGT